MRAVADPNPALGDPDGDGLHSQALSGGAGDLTVAPLSLPADVLDVHVVADVAHARAQYGDGLHSQALSGGAGDLTVAPLSLPADVLDVHVVAD